MTNGYKPRIGDLLVYDTNVYRVVAVKTKNMPTSAATMRLSTKSLSQKAAAMF